MIQRIKRKELDGFKEFVANLESTPTEKRLEIIQVGMLEDPTYMEWVIKNMATIDHVLDLPSEEIAAVFRKVPNGVNLLAKAFFRSPYHDKLVDELMPKDILGQYLDAIDFIKDLKKSEQDGARYMILKTMRNLQESNHIIGPPWTIPPVEIIRASDKMISKNGVVELHYENGTLAAKGEVLRNLRTGKWIHYFQNGSVMAEGQYSKGSKHGKWKFYYPDQSLRSEGEYVYDSKDGEWIEIDKQGTRHVAYYEQGIKGKKKEED